LALIRCPECGRQNVSDTAVACPECGYAIREHFERIKDEEERKKKAEALSKFLVCLNLLREQKVEKQMQLKAIEKRKELEERIRAKGTKRARQEQAVADAKKRIKKSKLWLVFYISLGLFLIGIQIAAGDFILWSIFFIIFDLFYAFLYKQELDVANADLRLALDDVDRYETKIKNRAVLVEKLKHDRIAQKQRIKEAQHPVCPNCGSKNTHHISTANRAISTYALGVGSSTIGKQYKCDDCKHMW